MFARPVLTLTTVVSINSVVSEGTVKRWHAGCSLIGNL